MSEQLKKVVDVYLATRDERDAVKKRHSEELAPINEKLKKIENGLLQYLDRVGAKHVATDHGTVYKAVRTSCKVADWDLVLKFIRDEGLWHMLEKRVSKGAVEDYLEDTQELPPGVDISREAVVNIRRS